MKSLQDYIFEENELDKILYSNDDINIYEWTNYNSTGYKVKQKIKKGLKKFWNWLWGNKEESLYSKYNDDDYEYSSDDYDDITWDNLGTLSEYKERAKTLNKKNLAKYINGTPIPFEKNKNYLLNLVNYVLNHDSDTYSITYNNFKEKDFSNISSDKIKGLFKFINEKHSSAVVIGFAIYILPCTGLTKLIDTDEYDEYLHIRYIETAKDFWTDFDPGVLTSLIDKCLKVSKQKNLEGITINEIDKKLFGNISKIDKYKPIVSEDKNHNLVVLKNR